MKRSMNASWHDQNPMPRNPTLAQRAAWHLEHQRHCSCRPIPEKLLAWMEAQGESTRARPEESRRHGHQDALRALLSGGDRRSIARGDEALEIVRANPDRVGEVAGLALDGDVLVSMRAMDLLEKLAHGHADWIQPHKSLFIGPLADSDRWEIRLQLVRALPLLKWTAAEKRRVVDILARDVDYDQTFVRAWALDGLATLAESDRKLLSKVRNGLEDFEASGKKALVARARQIRERLARSGIDWHRLPAREARSTTAHEGSMP